MNKLPNDLVQATPVCASLLFLGQWAGAPDHYRYAA
jgi:hypothetical protein